MRRLIAAVGVVALLTVGAAPRDPFVKSIACDKQRGRLTNCEVTLWDRDHGRYATYPVSKKRTIYCFDKKLTDCVLRLRQHPGRYRFYWGLSVDVTPIRGGGAGYASSGPR